MMWHRTALDGLPRTYISQSRERVLKHPRKLAEEQHLTYTKQECGVPQLLSAIWCNFNAFLSVYLLFLQYLQGSHLSLVNVRCYWSLQWNRNRPEGYLGRKLQATSKATKSCWLLLTINKLRSLAIRSLKKMPYRLERKRDIIYNLVNANGKGTVDWMSIQL